MHIFVLIPLCAIWLFIIVWKCNWNWSLSVKKMSENISYKV
jgi:hypothetical protein